MIKIDIEDKEIKLTLTEDSLFNPTQIKHAIQTAKELLDSEIKHAVIDPETNDVV